MSYNVAMRLGDAFVRVMPHPLQRLSERQFDFPISQVVRQSPLLLIRVPKTASVSLSLQIYGRVSHVPHRTALFYRQSDPEFFELATSFAVVRHPAERMRSAYRWLKSVGNELAAPNGRSRRRMQSLRNFEAFVLDLALPAFENGRLNDLDPTVHRQCDYVCDANETVIVDQIFRLERMGDVQAFLADRGITTPEARANVSRREEAILEPTSSDVERAIGRIYARDYALFGY